jgi:hypothetical protein
VNDEPTAEPGKTIEGTTAEAPGPRLFHLERDVDVSGVSGIGRVADGIVWPDGSASVRWRGEQPSTVTWDQLAHAEAVHGHGGQTRIVFDDDPESADQQTDASIETSDSDADAGRVLSVYVQCAKRFAWTTKQTDEAMQQLGGERLLLEFLSTPEPPAPIQVGVGMPAAILLDAFGEWLHQAFGATAYLVGSALRGKSWRDVDVRLLMQDDAFHALFPGYSTANQGDSKWSLVCAAISVLAKQQTGLPIDFQIQSVTEANSRYPGPRNPLRLRRHEEA